MGKFLVKSERMTVHWLWSICGEKRPLLIVRHLQSTCSSYAHQTSPASCDDVIGTECVNTLPSAPQYLLRLNSDCRIRQSYTAVKAEGLPKPLADLVLVPNTQRARERKL